MPPAAANAGAKDQQDAELGAKQRDTSVRDAVENVFARAMSEVTCRESMQHVTHEAILQCLNCCQTVVDMAFPQRESQPISDIALKNQSWEPHPEPVPCAVDTWIRSAIPEVEKPVARDVAPGKTAAAHHDAAPSMRRSGMIQGVSDVAIKSPDRAARNTASASGSPTGRPSTTAERHAEERLREELDARKAQAAVVQRMKQKDEDARTKLATLQKDLRGRDYAYNHKGEVVVLSKLDPDKMPASVAPDLRVATPPPPPDQQNPQRAASPSPAPPSRPSPKATAKPKASISHRAGAPKPYSDAEYKELPSRSQPNAMDTMKLTGGVMLRQGDKLRKGPARPPPPPQSSR